MTSSVHNEKDNLPTPEQQAKCEMKLKCESWGHTLVVNPHQIQVTREKGPSLQDWILRQMSLKNIYIHLKSFIPLHVFPSHYQTLQAWDPHSHLNHNLEHHLDHLAQQVMTLAAAVLCYCKSTILYMVQTH